MKAETFQFHNVEITKGKPTQQVYVNFDTKEITMGDSTFGVPEGTHIVMVQSATPLNVLFPKVFG